MAEPTAPAGADNPEPPKEQRTCQYCNAVKIITPETWPYRKGRDGHYAAHGARCMDCEKKRKSEYEARRDAVAKAILPPKEDEKKDAKTPAKKERLDVARALKAGGHVLNNYAPSALARLVEYAEDPLSPHHIWALELMLQRVLPRKLFEELGGQAAGVGALQDRRPQFVLNIHPAQPDAPQGRVYENEVPALPDPADDES